MGEVVVREPHNSFVTALVRGGLIGFIPWMLFFLWLIGRLATVIINGASHRDAERTYALWLAIVLLSAFVTSIFEPVFELPFEAMPIYLLCGAFAAECRLTRSAQSHSASSAPAA